MCLLQNQGRICHNLRKMVCLGHRCYIDPSDPLHDDVNNFPHKKDRRHPPTNKDMEYVDYYNKRYDEAITQEERNRLARKSGCKGKYIIRHMPRHNRITDTPVDPMHLFKNIGEHLVQLISGVKIQLQFVSKRKHEINLSLVG